MIYYFGWIVLAIDNATEVPSETELNSMLSSVDDLLLAYRKNFQLCERRNQNYLETLFISSAHNHDIGYKEDVLNLYKQVGILALGSYGLLYLRLPEDEKINNEFLVYRLAKGVLTEHRDTLLSPCVPTIENISL